jgi:hypothetical protein
VAELQRDVSAWRARFEGREPRPEDVARIGQLEGAVRERDEALRGAEGRMAALRNELLLRWAWGGGDLLWGVWTGVCYNEHVCL